MTRLQIAARIHFFLKRELGTGIDVETMLKRASYAGEVLALCDGARGTELERLARQFRVATAEAERPARARVAQPWAEDTSGFGLSRPLADDQVPSPKRSSSPPSAT